MGYQKLLKLMAGLAGVMLAATGALLVALVAAGQVREGQTGALISGIGLLVMAALALATSFSSGIAKLLLILELSSLAVLAMWHGLILRNSTEIAKLPFANLIFI